MAVYGLLPASAGASGIRVLDAFCGHMRGFGNGYADPFCYLGIVRRRFKKPVLLACPRHYFFLTLLPAPFLMLNVCVISSCSRRS
jgi:hypothetical protein